MKKLLNTLYITTQGAFLKKQGETVFVSVKRETKLQLPIHTIGQVVCIGNVTCTSPFLGLCGKYGVGVAFLSQHGKFLASSHGPTSGNVLLRKEQYRRAENLDRSADLARMFVSAKIANCRTVLLRAIRDASEDPNITAIKTAADRLAGILNQFQVQLPLDTVRGYEGEAGSTYFGVFDHLIAAQKEDFFFRGRSKRPPLDPMNALLSFLYTLLASDMKNALEAVGLDPQVGFLHRDRPGRAGLALDLMEELRPYLADRLALSLVNRQQVKGNGFTSSETGAVLMDDDTRKVLLVAYQKRKQEEIQHPFLEEKIPLGLLPHVQAMLFARHLRGDLDGYPAFFWR